MRKLLLYLGIIILIAVIVVTFQYYHSWQPWTAYETGSLNTSGTPPNYNYWSGFGSVFPWELGIFVSVWIWMLSHYRINNCHVTRCPRLGRFPAAGGNFKVCQKHHPESHVRNGKVTFEHIRRAQPCTCCAPGQR